MPRVLRAWVPLCLVIALAACGSDDPPPFQVRASVEQLHVTHAPPATELEVVDASGAQVQVGTTDELGSLMFRKVPAGAGYHVRTTTATPALTTGPFEVMSVASSQPPQSFYDGQTLDAGFHYITTRDGTTLSAYVTFPAGDPPYPTVVTYSGYDPSKPGEPLDASLSGLCDVEPAICDAPNDPSGLIAALFGYATVNVNIRGTGCSGTRHCLRRGVPGSPGALASGVERAVDLHRAGDARAVGCVGCCGFRCCRPAPRGPC